ncbi:hypothetical protein [Nonomuraea salmonea]|uniref:LysM peptidoglycan-binding domain-containing protein n=1 Tax=Nonomuraea salmonea TaxID=46181 RepID=UPI002FE97F5E
MVAPLVKLAPTPAAPPVTAVAYSAPLVEQTLETPKTKKVYVVQPPHGRHHESLWEIAEKCLGDGRRYHEIYRLNQAKEQPDGTRLKMADLIRPGWVLDMPDDARNAHIVPADQPREKTLREHPGRAQVERELPKKATGKHSKPEAAQEQRRDQRPEQRQDRQEQRQERQEQQPVIQESRDGDLVDYLAAASLAAAGLLFVLAGKRREQLWRRVFGRRIARPHDDAAQAEVALRLGSDAPGARVLDVGLRMLGAELAARRRTPPTVYGAHLSPRTLDLWIHPPDPDPPAPWIAVDGGQVWRLPAHEGRLLPDPPDRGHAGAPYPGLVSIGTDDGGRVLIDLEAAQGLINVRGAQTTAALAALAVELATNRWSDRMRITLVGFGAELTAIAPGRIRAVGGLAEVLPELEAGAAPRTEVLTGRITGSPRRAHYLLSAVAPHPRGGAQAGAAGPPRHRRLRGGRRGAARHLDAGDRRRRPGQDRRARLRGGRPAPAPPPLPRPGRPVPHRRPARRRAHTRTRAARRPPAARRRGQDPRPHRAHRPAPAGGRPHGAGRRAAGLPRHTRRRRASGRARRRAVAARRPGHRQGRHHRQGRRVARPPSTCTPTRRGGSAWGPACVPTGRSSASWYAARRATPPPGPSCWRRRSAWSEARC